MLDVSRIEAAGLVKTIDYHPSLSSTNDRAIDLAARGEVELPLLVTTERQTAGRGRGSNRWLSDEGGLTFSLAREAIADSLPQARWPEVALAAGLAVCRALQEALPTGEFRVKWPNDVYLAEKKVCGILSESVPGWRNRLVLGIGVNVNNRFEACEVRGQTSGASGQESGKSLRVLEGGDEVLRSAVSLVDYDGISRDLTSVLISILDEFDQAWWMLNRGDHAHLLHDYRAHCFLTGKIVTIADSTGLRTVGLCLGIDERGRLRLQTGDGPKAITSGTVSSWDG